MSVVGDGCVVLIEQLFEEVLVGGKLGVLSFQFIVGVEEEGGVRSAREREVTAHTTSIL